MSNSITDEKRRLMELMLQKKRQSAGESLRQTIPKRDMNEPPELSFAQQRLWFLDELTPGNPAYAFCNIVRLNGKLDVDSLEKSFNEIVSRHENLRTTFNLVDGIPVQTISEVVELPFPRLDISTTPESKRENELQKITFDEARKPFDLSTGPLIRATYVKIDGKKHAVILTMHHIVYDGWSLAVLFSELQKLYEAYIKNEPSPLKPLDIQYADFALWQRREMESDKMQKQLDYWSNALSGHLPTLELPVDRKRPTLPKYEGEMAWFYLSKSLTNSLEALAKREECTLFMVLLAAFNILISRYSGETDIIVGTPIANRNKWEIENLIGFFINSLVMRTLLQDDQDFCQLLEQVKKVSTGAYANQDYPFEKLVDNLNVERNVNQNPVFQIMFALQNTPQPPKTLADVQMQIEEVDSGTAVFDITLSMYETADGLNGYFEYSSELFDRSTIENMINSFETLLTDIVENPEKEITKLSVLNSETYNKIIQQWNSNKQSYPQDTCIFNQISDVARNNPDAIAIATEENQYTYQQLDQQANKLANELVAKGVKPDDFVGICLNRSFEMFVSILGILKSGAAYLPMDPAYPKDRLAFMLEDTKAKIIVSAKEFDSCLPEKGFDNFYINDLLAGDEKISPPAVKVKSENLAYIIYTSGSTGKPKGVMVTHKNLVHSTSARMAYYPDKIERFLLLSSFAFDSSVAGIFWTLCQGGALHLPKQGEEKDIQQVAALLCKVKATHMLSLPSIYSLLLSVSEQNQLESLNTIIVAGETCPPELVQQHNKMMPQATLYNEYGPTEGSVWSTVYKIEKDADLQTVPIGKPISNVQIYILSKELSPVPVGVIGEIYIGGAGITRGYLNRDELTTEKYINDPFSNDNKKLYRTGDLAKYQPDGNIVFCGRTDHQVKIRGYRIELGEIESALSVHEGINDVVVVAKERNISSNNNTIEEMAGDISLLSSRLESLAPDKAEMILSEIGKISESDADAMSAINMV